MSAAQRSLWLFLALTSTLAAQGSIRVHEGPSSSQFLQRNGNSGTLSLSGEASQDGAIRISMTLRGQTVGRWSNVEAGQAKNGSWAAEVTGLPAGGPYRVSLRIANAEAVIDPVYVGDIWVLAGQSNMVGRARLDMPEPPLEHVRMLLADGTWKLAEEPLHERKENADGEPIGAGSGLTFAKEMVQRTGIPIGLIPCAVGGTNLTQWDPAKTDSLFGKMMKRIEAAGGRVAGVLWYQGEADSRDTRAKLYAERFRQLVASMRAGLRAPNLPLYYAQLARFTGEELSGHTVESEDIVRETQRKAEEEIPHSRMLATIGLDLGDHIHLDAASQKRLGRRFVALVCADRFPGNARCPAKQRGPRLASLEWESPYRLRVRFSDVNGSLQSTGRPMGFSIADEAGKARQLVYRTEIHGSEVLLLFNRLYPFPRRMSLWYGRGFDPACNLTDASDLAVPAFGPIELPARPEEKGATR